MLLNEIFQIFDISANESVEALITPISDKHIEEIELIWKPQLSSQSALDQNFNITKYLNQPNIYEVYVLTCENNLQGIIVLSFNRCASSLKSTEKLVYLNLVNVAPWNRIFLEENRRYKGVGSSLVVFGISRSIELGFEGRVGLHSLEEAENFYRHLGFVDLGYDLSYLESEANPSPVKYFEMTERQAELTLLNFWLSIYLS
ncbi:MULTISPECIES: GNAT family N-acetyltransferase [unclassified Nostoc]|uniref:GNAT family N-acetyltransferase n=1 Tax=unclassified Nostoc TaxID=2593658 RepID=UPI00261653BC|nr:GNAT family N-acetyltransferase [Nostoc sp. S13]MDF5737889.1 GNAT family N-acetyltransferase [Nostoc sp. S13]